MELNQVLGFRKMGGKKFQPRRYLRENYAPFLPRPIPTKERYFNFTRNTGIKNKNTSSQAHFFFQFTPPWQ